MNISVDSLFLKGIFSLSPMISSKRVGFIGNSRFSEMISCTIWSYSMSLKVGNSCFRQFLSPPIVFQEEKQIISFRTDYFSAFVEINDNAFWKCSSNEYPGGAISISNDNSYSSISKCDFWQCSSYCLTIYSDISTGYYIGGGGAHIRSKESNVISCCFLQCEAYGRGSSINSYGPEGASSLTSNCHFLKSLTNKTTCTGTIMYSRCSAYTSYSNFTLSSGPRVSGISHSHACPRNYLGFVVFSNIFSDAILCSTLNNGTEISTHCCFSNITSSGTFGQGALFYHYYYTYIFDWMVFVGCSKKLVTISSGTVMFRNSCFDSTPITNSLPEFGVGCYIGQSTMTIPLSILCFERTEVQTVKQTFKRFPFFLISNVLLEQ